MAPKEQDGGAGVFSVALLGYSRKDFDYITKLINLVNLDRPLKLCVNDLSKSQNINCNLAIAILDNVSNINKYNKDIAQIKQGVSKPIVICAAREADRQVLESHRSGLKADTLIFIPTAPEYFIKIVQQAATETRPNEHEHDTVSIPVEKTPSAGKIGELFVKARFIKPEDLERALGHQKEKGGRLGDVLVALGLINEDQKLQCLSEQLKCAIAAPERYEAIDLNVAALVPEHLARRFSCIALEKRDNELIVAVTDVLNLKMLDALRDTTDMRVTAVLGKNSDILAAIERCYRDISSQNDVSRIAESMEQQVEFFRSMGDDSVDAEDAAAAGEEAGIVKLVNILITNAIRDRASDIHIEPMENEVVVRYRVDGDLRRVMSPPKRSHNAIVARIKILSGLDLSERRVPQDGRMMIKLGNNEADLIVSVLPTIFGEKAVLRVLHKNAFEKNTSSLGFSQADEHTFRSQIAKPSGIIIVTGPTGSGKTTTLYSALQVVKNIAKNVIAVEDPVELRMDGISQVRVNTKTGLTFPAALRSILCQDPDVVLIGEVSDYETADLAFKMALTGKLVFATLHTNNAVGAVTRSVDIGIPPLLMGASLNLIVAQRLVKKVCEKCKTPYTPDPELLQSLNLDAGGAAQFYKGSGCVSCNGTGFSGRTAVFEMLLVSKAIRAMIMRGAPAAEIQAQAVAEGMKTLRQAGLELALNGTTTIEQVIAATIDT